MRFTVTATNPQTGQIVVIDVDAADPVEAGQHIAASGLPLLTVQAAFDNRIPPARMIEEGMPARIEALQFARRATVFAGVFGYPLGVLGGIAAVFALGLGPFVALVVGLYTLGPAIIVLLLSHHARQLRFWAVISLLTVASLLAAFFIWFTIKIWPSDLWGYMPGVMLLATGMSLIGLFLMLGIIYNSARVLHALSRARNNRAVGFAVEPAKSHAPAKQA